jgi:hypothetical protein
MMNNEARQHLERYLEEMRSSMRDCENDGAAEIEQDIRDHVEAELGERGSTASVDDLDEVLTRLGAPRQWALAGTAPQPVTVRGLGGIEEWMAYASIALLLLGFVLPPLILVSWLTARWALARLEQRGEHLGAGRWLFYAPLAAISIAVALLLLLWPFGALAELGMLAARNRGAAGSDHFPPAITLVVTFGGLSLYWAILGVLAALSERVVRFVFHPFAARFRPRLAWWWSGIAATAALCAAMVLAVIP